MGKIFGKFVETHERVSTAVVEEANCSQRDITNKTRKLLLQVFAVRTIVHDPLDLLSLQQLQDHWDVIGVDEELSKIFKLQDVWKQCQQRIS